MKLKTLHLLGYLCFNILIILSLNIIKLNAKNYKINSNKKISGAPKVQICLPVKKNNGKVKGDITMCYPVEPPHIPNLDYELNPSRVTIHSMLHSLFDSVENNNALLGNALYPIVPNPSEPGVMIDTILRDRPIPDASNYMWHIGRIPGTINYVIMSSQTHTVLEEDPDNNFVELQPEDLNRLNRYQQWRIDRTRLDGYTTAVLINAGSGRVLTSRLYGSLVTEDLPPNRDNVETARARHGFYLLPESETDPEIDPRR